MRVQAKRRILVLIFLAGIICIVMVVLTALAAELRYENDALITQNKALQGEVDTLQVKIKSANKISHIETVAVKDLGMVYPDEDACVYITDEDTPEQNFARVIRREAYQ